VIQVRFWGVRGDIAVPGPETIHYGGNSLCTTVTDVQDALCILDAGTGLTALGRERMATVGRDQALFLVSHSHWTHTQGIGFYAPFFVRGNTYAFYGLGTDELGFRGFLEAQLAPALSPLHTLNHLVAELAFHEPTGEPLAWGSMTIHPYPTWRGPGAPADETWQCGRPVAYRLSQPDRSLVYLPRMEDPAGQCWERLVAFCRNADVLIHGAYHDGASGQDGTGHTSARSAVRLAQQAGVRQLVLTCYNPLHGDAAIDQMVDMCRALAGNSPLQITGAWEGLVLTF
jgi:hypothetical protein